MNGRMKALSTVLAVVALIGLVTSGMTVNDVLSQKGYWEEKSAESDANLAKLEDGLNQLQDNEQAYIDGRVKLADGKQQYDAGKKKLEDGYAQYAKGQQDYENGKKEYAAGKKLLDSKTEAFNNGKVQKVQAKQVYDAVNKLMNGYSHAEAVATVAAATGNNTATIQNGYDNGSPEAQAANKAQLELAKQAYDAVDELMNGYSHEKAVATVAAKTGKDVETIETAYQSGNPTAYAAAQQQIAENKGKLAAAKQAHDAVDDLVAGYSQDKAIDTVAAKTGKSVAEIQEAYAMGSDDAQAAANDQLVKAKNVYDAVEAAKSAGYTEEQAFAAVASQTGKSVDEIKAAYAKGNPQAQAAAKAQLAAAKQAYAAVNDLMRPHSREEAVATVAESTGKTTAEIEQAYGMGTDEAQDQANAQIDAASAQLEQAKAAYEAAKALEDGYSKDKAIETVADATGRSTETVAEGYKMGNPQAQEAAYAQLEQAKAAYEGVKELEDGYSKDKAIATVAKTTGKDTATINKGYDNGNPQAQAAIQKQLDEYTNGQAKLKAAEKQLAEAPGKLADAEKQLADGEAQLADAAKQIEDGEAQLKQFEDGAAQAKDGIQQVVDTQADGGLESIASRLGDGFTYEKSNGDLDISAGFTALEKAREYKGDSGVAIENELYGRVYAAVAALVASLAALVAAFLAFKKKYKGAMPCAAVSAVAAVVASVLANKAGMEFSSIAGSTMGSVALYAGIILAVAAAVHAVASGAAAKAK